MYNYIIKILKHKLGFLNGDTLGFVLESIEIISMVLVANYGYNFA